MNTSRAIGARERVRLWSREGAVAELCGPSGFWAACREAARAGDVGFLDELSAPETAQLLDDRSPAASGVRPSARLAGLVAAGRLALNGDQNDNSGEESAAVRLRLISQIVGAFRAPRAAPWDVPTVAALGDLNDDMTLDRLLDRVGDLAAVPELGLVRDLLNDAAARPFAGRSAVVRVLLARAGGRGQALFSVRDVEGPPGLLPDVAAGAFTRWDNEFQQALDQAWWAAGLPERAVRWSLRWESNGQPVELVEGPSIGLGAALAILQLTEPTGWATQPGWAVTGAIDEAGEVVSLLDSDAELSSSYREKLAEVPSGSTVVLPIGDRAAVTLFLQRTELAVEVLGVEHLNDLRSSTALTVVGEGVCPYKGLGPFGETDAMWFHGREKIVAELVQLVERDCLVGVMGASGAGKSSTVRAGLLPALARGAIVGSERWQTALCTPGADPWENLTEAVQHLDSFPIAPSARAFAKFLERRDPQAPTLVLVIDQFEELFTMAKADQVEPFLAGLAAAASGEHENLRIIPIIRADFYGEVSRDPDFARLLSNQHVLVGPMTARDLLRVVTAPATRAGLVLEPALVDTVLDDVAGQPTALPHLSTALRETWARREGRTLTLAGYEAAGGVENAIAQLADQLYANAADDEQTRMRRLILRLVGLGDERNFRRRSPLGDVAHDLADRELLEKMTVARLVAVSDQGVELAHDAVISYWPRLGSWLEESREQLLAQRRLAQAALEWQAEDRQPDGLLRGARLAALTEQLRSAQEPELTDLETAYLDASQQAERDARDAAERTTRRLRRRLAITSVALAMAILGGLAFVWQRERASHQEDLAAKAQADRARVEQAVLAQSTLSSDSRARSALLSLAALADGPNFEAVVGLGSSLSNFNRPVESYTVHADDVETGVLSADGTLIASGSWDRTVRTWDASNGTPVAVLKGSTTTIRSVALSPTGEFVAAVSYCDDPESCDDHLRVWRSRSGDVVLDESTGGENLAVGFTDDSHLAVAQPATMTLWTLAGKPTDTTTTTAINLDKITALATSPGGSIAVADKTGAVRWWTTENKTPRNATVGHPVSALAFSPDSALLAVGDRTGAVNLLDTVTGAAREPSPTPVKAEEVPPLGLDENQAVLTLAFNKTGDLLSGAGGSREKRAGGDNDVRVWSLPDQHLLRRFVGGTDPVRGVGFRADGSILAIGAERRIRVYETTASGQLWQKTEQPRCNDDNGKVDWLNPSGECWLTSVAFSGNDLAVTGWDKTMALIDPNDGHVITRNSEPGSNDTTPFWSWGKRLSVDQTGQHLAAGTDDGGVQIWRRNGNQLSAEHKLPGRTDPKSEPILINQVRFDPTGNRLATAAGDGTIELWDLRTNTSVWHGRHHTETDDEPTFANDVTWSLDGTRIVSAGGDARIRIWNAETGAEIATSDQLPYFQNISTWSPDNKTILTAGSDGVIRLWNPNGLQLRREFYFDSTSIVSAAFNHDSTLVVIADQAKVIRVVDLASGRQLAAFPLDTQPLEAIFSPTGDRIIVTDKDGKLTTFSGPEAWVTAACNLAGRNLTTTEWNLYIGANRPYTQLCTNLPPNPAAPPSPPQATNLAQHLITSLDARAG